MPDPQSTIVSLDQFYPGDCSPWWTVITRSPNIDYLRLVVQSPGLLPSERFYSWEEARGVRLPKLPRGEEG